MQETHERGAPRLNPLGVYARDACQRGIPEMNAREVCQRGVSEVQTDRYARVHARGAPKGLTPSGGVCLRGMPGVCARRVCQACMSVVYARGVCQRCMPERYARSVCQRGMSEVYTRNICQRYISKMKVRPTSQKPQKGDICIKNLNWVFSPDTPGGAVCRRGMPEVLPEMHARGVA